MTVLLMVLVFCFGAGSVGAAALFYLSRWRVRRVRVHFLDGPSIEGVLLARPKGFYHLVDVTVHAGEAETFSVEDAWVPASRVLWWQEVTASE